MKRLVKLTIAVFIAAACVIFAAALAGGLMDDRAFTPEATDESH